MSPNEGGPMHLPGPSGTDDRNASQRGKESFKRKRPSSSETGDGAATKGKKRRKTDPTAKRVRLVPTAYQATVLRAHFIDDKFPPATKIAQIAQDINMSPRRVQVWFQNRRQDLRRQQLRGGPLQGPLGAGSSIGSLPASPVSSSMASLVPFTDSSSPVSPPVQDSPIPQSSPVVVDPFAVEAYHFPPPPPSSIDATTSFSGSSPWSPATTATSLGGSPPADFSTMGAACHRFDPGFPGSLFLPGLAAFAEAGTQLPPIPAYAPAMHPTALHGRQRSFTLPGARLSPDPSVDQPRRGSVDSSLSAIPTSAPFASIPMMHSGSAAAESFFASAAAASFAQTLASSPLSSGQAPGSIFSASQWPTDNSLRPIPGLAPRARQVFPSQDALDRQGEAPGWLGWTAGHVAFD